MMMEQCLFIMHLQIHDACGHFHHRKIMDYVMNTPEDGFTSAASVKR